VYSATMHTTPAGASASILVPSQKRARLLFLHGQGTSADIALTLLRMRGWLHDMPFEFVIPDGPHQVEAWTDGNAMDNLGLKQLQDVGLYDVGTAKCMWAARFDEFAKSFALENGGFMDATTGSVMFYTAGGELANLDEIVKEQGGHGSPEKWKQTVKYLADIIATYGPFDGIGGFSEGAAVAHSLLCLQGAGTDIGLGSVRFCLALSPWVTPMIDHAPDQAKFDHRLLLTFGLRDLDMFHHAAALYTADFERGVMHEFDGAHEYPPVTTELRRICWNLVQR